MSVVLIDPSLVYFTFSRIRPQFSCGRTIQSTLDAIENGSLSPASLPTITVLFDQQSGNYFSLNNRRLYLFKKLREMGVLQTVPARLKLVPDTRRMGEKYSAAKCSRTATLMGASNKQNKSSGDQDGVDDHHEEDEGDMEEETEECDEAKEVDKKKNKAHCDASVDVHHAKEKEPKKEADPKPAAGNKKGKQQQQPKGKRKNGNDSSDDEEEKPKGSSGGKTKSLASELEGLHLGEDGSDSEDDTQQRKKSKKSKKK